MATLTLAEARALIIKTGGKPYYCYVLLRPTGEPFYVGVGKGRRILDHENRLRAGVNRHKRNIIAKIKAAGGEVGYEVAGWFYTWKEAGELERQLIARHGRINLGTGILCNLTDGADGTSGMRHSEESKAQMSAQAKGKPKSEAHRAALRASWIRDREMRLRIAKTVGAKRRGSKIAPDHLAKLHAGLKAHGYTAERAAKLSANLKGRKFSNEWLDKMSAAKKGWKPSDEVLAAGRKWRTENAGKLSSARKEIWNDPAYREKMSKALTGVKRSAEYSVGNRARQTAKFKDPEFRARWSAARAAGIARWKEEKRKARSL